MGGGAFRKSSRGNEAADDMEQADEQLARRAQGSATFRSVRAALGWFFAAEMRFRGPQGVSPRGEVGPDGNTHIVSVDGGKGGDLDEALATQATIRMALGRLQEDYPRAFQVLVARIRDGQSFRELEKSSGVSLSILSLEDARGEAFLRGYLRGVVT